MLELEDSIREFALSKNLISQTNEINVAEDSTKSLFEFEIYPIPTKDYVLIDNENSLENVNVLLFSSEGKIIKNLNLNLENTKLDISTLEKGIYYLKFIKDGEEIHQHKIVKL